MKSQKIPNNQVPFYEVSSQSDDFIRKRYRKPQNLENLQNFQQNPSDDNNSSGYPLKFPEIFDAKFAKTTKNKANLDLKLLQLVEFGLTPDFPFRKREIYKKKQSSQAKILLSDFISKKVQKQILSVHQARGAKEEIFEKDEKNFKVIVPSTGSFAGITRKNSLIRNSQSFQTLPRILTNDLDGIKLGKAKDGRDQKLKRIDKILDDCKVLLNDSKKDFKRMASQVTMRMSE
jgi:hypothetical protein